MARVQCSTEPLLLHEPVAEVCMTAIGCVCRLVWVDIDLDVKSKVNCFIKHSYLWSSM